MQIQLKRSHIAFCVREILLTSQLYNMPILLHIREVIQAGNYADDDLVTITISKSALLDIFVQLGGLNERLSASINQEMKALLLPQLMGMLSGANAAEAGELLTNFQAIDQQRIEYVNGAISEGNNWLER